MKPSRVSSLLKFVPGAVGTLALAGTFVACKQRTFNAAAVKATDPGNKMALGPFTDLSLKKYTDSCEAEVGPIPENLSCFAEANSYEVPVWQTTNGKTQRIGHEIPFHESVRCDNPGTSLPANLACIPYARMSYWKAENKTKGDATWSLLCRNFTSPAKGRTTFEAIGLIGHNERTGATCYFDTHDEGGDGRVIPKPSAQSTSYWRSPFQMNTRRESQCVACHKAYPYVTSAYALGVSPRHPDFQAQLTKSLTMLPRNNIDGPYYVVHEKELNEGARSPYTGELDSDMWTPRTVQVGEKTNACTACHRLGNTKRGMPHNVFFTDNNLQIERGDAVTDAMKEFPYSNSHASLVAFFPLPAGKKNLKEFKSEADWKESPFYTKSLKELVDVCYATPEACKGKRVDGN